MEGVSRLPGMGAAEYQRDHPGTVIDSRKDHWYAWTQAGDDRCSGELTHGRTEEELLAKLRLAGGGDDGEAPPG